MSNEVELVLRGMVVDGFVVDYADIATAWQSVHDELDHRYLNEVSGLDVPSTENLVAWMFRWFYTVHKRDGALRFWDVLERIHIKESSTTWCEMTKAEWLAFCGPNA
jgi:6-pyruvoyl-tetrahydropterin synthase